MNSPLEPNQLLLLLFQDLESWVAERKGKLFIAGDPGDLLEALTDKPLGWRCVLNWAGDEDQTGQAEVGIVDNTFEVWVFKARGLKLLAGDLLVAGDPPFLRLVSDLRARIRSYVFPEDTTNNYLLYKGTKQFEPELAMSLQTAGYKMTFELTTALPSVDYRV